MAGENDIVAVFRADIEQFKAQMAELSGKVGSVQTQIDGTTVSTEKFAKQGKSASGSIRTLSQGLGGVVGLLGITGRLFGVNTDKIQDLIFTSQQFVRVGRDLANTQRLTTAATQASTTATRAATIATAAASGGIALLVTGLIAAGTAIWAWISAKKEDVKVNEKLIKLQEELNAAQEDSIKISNDARVAALENQAAIIKAGGTETVAATEAVAVAEYKVLLEKQKQTQVAINNFNQRLLFDQASLRSATTDEEKAQAQLTLTETSNELNKLLNLQAAYNTQIAVLDKSLVKDVKKITSAASEASLKAKEDSLQREYNAFIKYWDAVDKKNRDAQKAMLEENKKFEEAKQKLLEDEFVEEQDSAFKNREIARENTKKRLDDEKELNDKRIDDAKRVSDAIFAAAQEGFDRRQELLDKEIDTQEKNIDVQRGLAERGLENTLAFEQKRAAELQRQQQIDAQKQKRAKLLETFFNNLAEFSKAPYPENKKALQKALLIVAGATAASSVFAEEGGIIGEIGERSNLRRRHKGGGDVLVHAQTGEGILSRREMDNLGKRNFHLLKDAARFPIRDDVFGMPKIAMAGVGQMSNESVVKELKALQHIIKNKKEMDINWDSHGNMLTAVRQDGINTITKKKIRFK